MTHSSEGSGAQQASDALSRARIVDATGNEASVVALDHSGPETLAWVGTEGGPQVLVPVSLLALQPDGTYRLPFSFNTSHTQDNGRMSFPVMREELHLGKRLIDTGKGVRIHKTVSTREQVIDEPLLRDELEIEHIPVDTLVAETDVPRMRYEGDTLIVPVLEEVLVLQKQLRLKEEVRITRHKREVHAPQSVMVRSEQVTVEHFDERSKGRA